MNYRYITNSSLQVLLSLILITAITGCDRTEPEEQWISALSERIAGDYLSLYNHSQLLADDVAQLCSTDTPKLDLTNVQAKWRSTMGAWQHVQWVRFGALVENNDDWKIQFWPDKKNILARKVQQLLEKEGTINQIVIADSSVVIQGLSALELLLFDAEFAPIFDEQTDLAGKQCQLLMAISQRLMDTTGKVSLQWQDQAYRNRWIATLHGDSGQLQVSALTDVVAAMLAQMEKIKLDKLGGPLGYKNRTKQPNGYFSESWRSNSSLDNIKTNLLSMQMLLSNQDKYDLRRLLEAKGSAQVADDIESRINELLQLLATVDMPLREAVSDVGSKSQLEEIHGAVGALNSVLKTRLATALNISLGFNSNDGD